MPVIKLIMHRFDLFLINLVQSQPCLYEEVCRELFYAEMESEILYASKLFAQSNDIFVSSRYVVRLYLINGYILRTVPRRVIRFS